MAQQPRPDEDDYLAQTLAHEVRRRGLAEDLRRVTERHARQRVEDFLDRAAWPYHPTDYWAMTSGVAAPGTTTSRPGSADQHP
ncbi:hypothetical protein [uncultured Serinicoccus sp.]|uniref:hypothetical protein n=1 Tax=uncultured Serinicoccus sp. TaxID=735514 RepID=UPI002629BEC0|nr:hypothetical protein [uncultured Serinicoccus sp.]